MNATRIESLPAVAPTAMKNPSHPGRSIKEDCLDPLGLTVTEAAKVLGVARHTLSRVINGHASISPGMARRLEQAGWSDAEYWMRRQASYDLAQARAGAEESRTGKELFSAIRAHVEPLGGIELELPPRGPMREPPRFE